MALGQVQHFVVQVEVAYPGVMKAFRAAGAQPHVVLGPQSGELGAVHRQIADEFCEQPVVWVLRRDVAQRRDGKRRLVVPVTVKLTSMGIEEE